jgi:molybdate transport system regulatory protein
MSESSGKIPGKAANYTVEGHIWVEGAEGTFLGMGRVLLLEKIREYGSITRAAGSLEMSYRKAWELVESMNRQAGSPLVVATTGGKGGGGAVLTEAGERAIRLFAELDAEFARFREKMNRTVKKGV